MNSFAATIPILIVVLSGIAAMLAEAIRHPGERMYIAGFGLIGLVGALVASCFLWDTDAVSFGVVRADNFALFVNVILCIVLTRLMAEAGLALALSLATIVEAAILYTQLRRKLGDAGGARTARTVGQTMMATALLAEVVAFFVLPFDLTQPTPGTLLAVLLAAGAGGGAFLAATAWLGSPEASLLLQRVPLLRR